MSDIATQIRTSIAVQFGVGVDKVVDNANLITDLAGDSLDVIELVMHLEEDFGIEIPDDEATKLATVKDVIEYVEKEKADA